jgi:Flagellar protein (FlbD).
MAKIIEVTNAGGAFLDKNDTKISINADLISRFEDLPEDNVGKTTIYLTNGISLNVVESQKQLRDIIINS